MLLFFKELTRYHAYLVHDLIVGLSQNHGHVFCGALELEVAWMLAVVSLIEGLSSGFG